MNAIATTEEAHQRMDIIQKAVGKLEPAEIKLTHRFTPGLYIRTAVAPKNAIVVSKTHRFEHPFVITKGVAKVFDFDKGVHWVRAGDIGITKGGTRRVIFAVEELEWTTFHTGPFTPESDVEEIVNEIAYDRDVSNAPELDDSILKLLTEVKQ